MSNEISTTEPKSILRTMSSKYGMEPAAFEATLRATVVPATTSREQFAAFLLVANEYGLNPLLKQIYAFPAKGGGIQPIVGIDGWCNIINSNPQLDGIEFVDIMTDGKLTAITCRISRKDRSHPTEAIEYMDECKRPTEPWKQWPARMLRHKALIQCARYAFGLSGIVDPDEAERMIDITPMVTDPETGEQITAKKSPFNKQAQRKEFYQHLQDALDRCKTPEDIHVALELKQPILDAMKVSKEDNDQFALDGIDTMVKMAQRRVSVIDITPQEDVSDFTEEEIEQQRNSGLREKL